jgi:hypothetical protein
MARDTQDPNTINHALDPRHVGGGAIGHMRAASGHARTMRDGPAVMVEDELSRLTAAEFAFRHVAAALVELSGVIDPDLMIEWAGRTSGSTSSENRAL